MPFESLTYKERKLVEIVEEHVWDNMGDVEHVPYGYETQPNISREVRNILGRFSVEDDPTARHIRHAPDAFIVQQNPQVLYLVDYKCTTVPLRSLRLKQQISQKAGKPVEFADIGVIHTASYDNYAALQKIGVKVAILTYIAYHDRHLLCDFIETIKPLRRAPVAYTEIGSGKDVINFDASQMRTLEEFLVQTHGLPAASIAPQIQRARAKLQKKFPIQHDPGSPHYTGPRR